MGEVTKKKNILSEETQNHKDKYGTFYKYARFHVLKKMPQMY